MRVPIFELALLATAAALVLTLLSRGSHPAARAVLRASWQLTPGVVNPAVTPATLRGTVCRKGWTATVRPPTTYTNELKRRQMRARGLRGPPSAYQEDHLISLELGGSPTDPRNLWPEPYPRAAEVDRIENELNARLCSGELTLDQAQRTESALKHADG
jgi:hypothetical protein